MGHVYYANYLVWFEMGRTEWLRSRGRRYDDLERAGFYLPVKEAWCEYQQPALYDQMVRIVTWVAEVRRASLRFGYEIHDAEAGGRGRLARGWTLHAFVDRERRIVAPPPDVAELLRSGLPPIVA
jgi:acyl-CoA thioester hydrolase